jgi:SAM-dependent methyltransferase
MGHATLEFARHGYECLGLDLSSSAIYIARKTARESPIPFGRGKVDYVVADFEQWEPADRFDNVCLFGVLHHCAQPETTLARVRRILAPKGRLILMEPTRDWMTTREAMVVALIRLLLSLHDGWYEPVACPSSQRELASLIADILVEYRSARDKAEAQQSPNDNASSGTAMLAALRTDFREVAFEKGFSFMPRVGGGVRAPTEDGARRISELLNLFDAFAVENGYLSPGEFYWAGEALGESMATRP